jgi:hypothetical protein
MVENVQDREAALSRREAEVERREADLALRLGAADEILAAADLRDLDAEERDRASVHRDQLADRVAFVTSTGTVYGTDAPGRRSAALDRADSSDDRAWAAADRLALTE